MMMAMLKTGQIIAAAVVYRWFSSAIISKIGEKLRIKADQAVVRNS